MTINSWCRERWRLVWASGGQEGVALNCQGSVDFGWLLAGTDPLRTEETQDSAPGSSHSACKLIGYRAMSPQQFAHVVAQFVRIGVHRVQG